MIILLVFLGLLFSVCIKKYVLEDIGDTFLATVCFLPAILFWISEQDISELSGFGIQAKFSERVQAPIEQLKLPIDKVSIKPILAAETDFQQASFFEACESYFSINIGNVPDFGTTSYKPYIFYATYALRSSIACGKLKGVIVLDTENRYIGSYDAKFFNESLSIWALDEKEIEAVSDRIIRRTIFGTALRFPDKRIRPGEGFAGAVNKNQSIIETFEKFQELDADFLAVTDALGKFESIVELSSVEQYIFNSLLQAQD